MQSILAYTAMSKRSCFKEGSRWGFTLEVVFDHTCTWHAHIHTHTQHRWKKDRKECYLMSIIVAWEHWPRLIDLWCPPTPSIWLLFSFMSAQRLLVGVLLGGVANSTGRDQISKPRASLLSSICLLSFTPWWSYQHHNQYLTSLCVDRLWCLLGSVHLIHFVLWITIRMCSDRKLKL